MVPGADSLTRQSRQMTLLRAPAWEPDAWVLRVAPPPTAGVTLGAASLGWSCAWGPGSGAREGRGAEGRCLCKSRVTWPLRCHRSQSLWLGSFHSCARLCCSSQAHGVLPR